MEFLTFSWIDYTLFIIICGLSVAIGIYYGFFAEKQNTALDYLLGGRNMKVFPVAMSLVGSTISGISLLALPAEIYLHGTLFMVTLLSPIVMVFASIFIYLPVYWKLNITTIFEYLEIRFDKNVRTIACFMFTLTNIFYLSMVIYVPSLVFNQVTGFDLYLVAVIMSVLCIFYTTIGGVKAVIWTDTFQLCITLGTLASVLLLGLISLGGFGPLWERAEFGERIEFFNFDPDPTARNTFWTVFIGTGVFWTTYVGANPASAQRFLTVPSLADSKSVLIIFTIFLIITKVICCFSGLIIYARYYDCDPIAAGYVKRSDQILPYYVLDVAARLPGISGLFVSGLFSTALSTLSTYLNSISGIIFNDLIESFFPRRIPKNKSVNIIKVITVVVGLINVGMIFIVEKLGTVIELISVINGTTLGPILGLFTMGMVFPFANAMGCLVGGITSLTFMVVITVMHEINVWNGSIKHPTKPLYTHGCNATTIVINDVLRTTQRSEMMEEEVFWLFRLSFHYFILIGTVLTIVIGLIVSWFTRNKYRSPVNPDTISPFVHCFLSKGRLALNEKASEKETEELHIHDVDR